MELITLHNISSYRHHILASYLRNKNSNSTSSSLFLSTLNANLRKDLQRTGMVEAIHARIKNADTLMIVAYIDGEKHLYMLNTHEDKIRYLRGG